eukprot:9097740-Pyramimonas_sp.AAC.1
MGSGWEACATARAGAHPGPCWMLCRPLDSYCQRIQGLSALHLGGSVAATVHEIANRGSDVSSRWAGECLTELLGWCYRPGVDMRVKDANGTAPVLHLCHSCVAIVSLLCRGGCEGEGCKWRYSAGGCGALRAGAARGFSCVTLLSLLSCTCATPVPLLSHSCATP